MAAASKQQGVSIEVVGSMVRIAGIIDEYANFDKLLTSPPPLKLLMNGVVAINSIGLRSWMRFIQLYGEKPLEFHECPGVFVEVVNMVPSAVSAKGDLGRIKSLVIPYSCVGCRVTRPVVVGTSDIKVEAQTPQVPVVACFQCGKPSRHDIDPEEFLYFMSAAA